MAAIGGDRAQGVLLGQSVQICARLARHPVDASFDTEHPPRDEAAGGDISATSKRARITAPAPARTASHTITRVETTRVETKKTGGMRIVATPPFFRRLAASTCLPASSTACTGPPIFTLRRLDEGRRGHDQAVIPKEAAPDEIVFRDRVDSEDQQERRDVDAVVRSW